MTVSSTITSVSYTGNGSTTAFPVTFSFFGTGTSAEIRVIEVVIATGAETVKVNGTDYTVTGGSGSTGTVTATTAPASTVNWVIRRNTSLLQETDYLENDPFPADSHELALDRLTLISQEQDTDLSRTVQLAEGYTGSFSPTLPGDLTANTALVVNSGGTAFESGPTTTEISNAQTYATNAATSETNAAASAAAASTSETNAGTSATNAGTSETNAAASASAASTSATNAATSETNAGNSATAAATSATNAATSETNAAASASAAAISETNAGNSATGAATSATNAATSETNAAASATSAAASATAASATLANAATLVDTQTFTQPQSVSTATDTSSSGSVTFDFSDDQTCKITLTENITSVSLTAPAQTGSALTTVKIIITQAAGGYTVSGWPAGVKWAAATAPAITVTNGAVDIVTMEYDGTNYYAAITQGHA